jgi:hypothetical protein
MKLGKITKNLQPTLVMAAGAIAGNYVQKMVPVGNDKVKAGAVLVAGLLLAGGKGMMGNLGSGIAIAGALNLAKSFGIGGGDFINGIEDARFINGFENLYSGEVLNGVTDYNYNDSYN